MIVVRYTQRARFGMGDDLAKLMKELFSLLGRDPRIHGCRILTDLSGPSFTVEAEFRVESLAVFEHVQAELFVGEGFARWFKRVQQVCDSGHRDFFHVVAG